MLKENKKLKNPRQKMINRLNEALTKAGGKVNDQIVDAAVRQLNWIPNHVSYIDGLREQWMKTVDQEKKATERVRQLESLIRAIHAIDPQIVADAKAKVESRKNGR